MTFASASQPGEGPSRGLLRDCTTSPINRFASLGVCPEELPAAGGPVPAEAGAGAEPPVRAGAPAPGLCRGGGRGYWWSL